MPKMTNPETGETKEITMEELMEAMQNGQLVGIQQEVHNEDGSEYSLPPIEITPARPNFFADEAALNCLLGMEFDDTDEFIDLTVDIIDSPIWLSFRTDDREQVLRAYTQLDMYTKNENLVNDIGSVVLDRSSKQVAAKALPNIGENMLGFWRACRNLSCLIQEKGLEKLYTGLDPEQAGILLEVKKGELAWKAVSGKDRPELMVQSLFGGITKGRPYMDDFFERSLFEEMSLEEHIEEAEDGEASSMEYLAMLYLNGDEDLDVEPDPEKCVYWLRKLAEAGDSNGMFNLGLHYAKGYGVERDFVQAVHWMEKAAEAGDEDAPAVAEEYKKLANSVEKAESGDAQAQADLAGGLMKLGGSLDQAGPGEDFAESVKWAEKSAAQDNGDGIWILALAYEHGRGVAQDKKKAVDLYQRGADLGHAKSQHSLGAYYMRGEIVKKDQKKAFDLFMKSAKQGYGLAMQGLGSCYQFGTGTDYDMDKAIEWYEKSLEVQYDPEIANKVAIFKHLGKVDESINNVDFFPAFREPDADEKVPVYTFNLTYTKKGDRKERSNRIKVGDKVHFEFNSGGDRIDAVTSQGDVGDVDAKYCWIAELIKKNIPYEAEIAKLISYEELDSKKKNPVIEVSLDLKMKWAEAKRAIGWRYLPEGINYYDSYETGKEPESDNSSSDAECISEQDEEFNNTIKNLAGTLSEHEKAGEHETENMRVGQDSGRFDLSYKKDIRCGDEKYSIGIPDSFEIEKNVDDRAFIAWLPDGAADYNEAKIVFYDGKIVSENDNDPRLYTPESSAALLENTFWSSPVHSLFQGAKIIPLNESSPGGIIIAQYEIYDVESAIHYHIQFCFKGCVKSMRVLILDVTEEDIPACDNMVVEWLKTLKLTEPLDVAKELDDPSFVNNELNQELVDEWKSCSDARYTVIFSTLDNRIAARSAKYKANASIGDSEADVIKDDQKYIESAASEYSAFLLRALDGLDAITRNNEGNPLLEKLYEVILPTIIKGGSLATGLGGVAGSVTAKIPYYTEIQQRFLALVPDTKDKYETPLFKKPEYKDKKIIRVGSLSVSVPDNMLLASEYHSSDDDSERFLDQLRRTYALVAIPADSEEGFDNYTECALCINMSAPQAAGKYAAKFDEGNKNKDEVSMKLISITEDLLKQSGRYNPDFPAEYVCGGNDYGIVLEQVEENIDLIKCWSQFIFMIFHKDKVYQGNYYINAKGERKEFVAAIKEWLQKIKPAETNTVIKGTAKKQKEEDFSRDKAAANSKVSSECQKRAKDFYKGKKIQFERFKRDWEDLCSEAPDKLNRLIREGITHNISRGNSDSRSSGSRTLTMNISFESNMDAAKEYVNELKKQIENTVNETSAILSEMSKKMDEFKEEGLDFESFKPLLDLFIDWADYCESKPLQIANTTINIVLDDKTRSVRERWADYRNAESRKKEAQKYGVSLSDLDRHKKYLDAKGKMHSAKTSSEMGKPINMFSQLKEYLDSKELLENCRKKKEEMKEAEEEEKRKNEEERRKAEEEEKRRKEEERKRKEEERKRKEEERKKKEEAERRRKKKEEEERKRREEEERIDNIYNDAVRLAGSNKIKNLQSAIQQFEEISDKRDVSRSIVECEDRIAAIEEENARKKKKRKRTAILILIAAIVATAAYFGILFKLKTDMTKQLIDSSWYDLSDSGLPLDKLDFEDKETATMYSDFDLLEDKWSHPYEYKWSYDSFNLFEATINLGDELTLKASKKGSGSLELTGENFVGTYVAVSDDEYEKTIKKLAADRREQLYMELSTALNQRNNEEAAEILDELGDYKDTGKIKEEMVRYNKVMTKLSSSGTLTRDAFAEALEYVDSAKYVKMPVDTESFVKNAGPFVGKWKYSSGDIRTITYKSKNASSFESIETIDITAELNVNTGAGKLHMTYNGGSTGTYIDIADINNKSFDVTKYVGGNLTYSIVDDDTMHVSFKAKSGSSAPSQASVDYARDE